MRRIVLALAAVILLVGCDRGPEWQTRYIGGLMPELQFRLTDENGQTVTAAAYADTVNLLFFGYTSCPDVCPITLGQMRQVLDRLPEGMADQIRVLFVSVDPERDDPESLRRYADFFGDRFVGLTGSREQLDTLTRRYRTTYGYGEPDAQGNYPVSHGSAVYAFDTQGRAQLLIRGEDTIDAILADLIRLVQG
ncbi:MAG: SCO family protein [Oceanospirillaceae bacterium]|jgi:protein SCO1/2|uniref:SCO family protein n=1 Tax=Marinobacterium litorale TaxID=404770 RepID=UPI000425839C|nr:SCO family protein [Marinobacterium litorale]MBS97720.1 SCO family protein [Oceanospirillaceae bacterium]